MRQKQYGRLPGFGWLLSCMLFFTCFSENVNARNMRVSIQDTNYIAEIAYDAKDFRAWFDRGGFPEDADLVDDPEALAKLYAVTRAFLFIERMVEKESTSSLLTSNQAYAAATLAKLHEIAGWEAMADLTASYSGKIFAALLLPNQVGALDFSDLALDLYTGIGIQKLVDLTLSSEITAASALIDEALRLVDTLPISDPLSSSVDINTYFQAANNIVNGIDYFTDISLRLAQDERLTGTIEEDLKSYTLGMAKGFISVFVPDTGEKAVLVAKWADGLAEAHGHISTAVDATNFMEALVNRSLAVHRGGFSQISSSRIFDYRNFFADREISGSGANSSVLIDDEEADLLNVVSGPSAEDISDARFYVTQSILLEGYSGSQGVLVVLSEALPFDVSFGYSVYSYSTSNPTEASETSDFEPALNQQFTIPAGQLFGVVPVTVHDDNVEESLSEKFRFAVYDVSGATLPHGRYNDVYTGVIVDDDYVINDSPIDFDNPTDTLVDGEPPLPPTTSGCNLTALSVGTAVPGSVGNSEVNIEYRIANAGDSVCRGGNARIYIADTNSPSSHKYYGPDQFDLPSLDPGERRTRGRDIRLPNIGGNGSTKYLGIEVSPLLGDEDVPEDNHALVPFMIGPGIADQPDLRVHMSRAYVGDIEDPVVLWNSPVGLKYTISARSQGAPPYRYRILLSKDEFLSSDDVVLEDNYSHNGRGLGGNGTHSYEHQVLIPSGLAKGIWYIFVQVDPYGEIDESDESNNTYKRGIIVENSLVDVSNGLPNLYLDKFDVEDRFFSSDGRMLLRFINTPTSPSVPLFDSNLSSRILSEFCIALSKDVVLDGSDIIFLSNRESFEQPIGGYRVMVLDEKVPTWLLHPNWGQGSYYLFAKNDCEEAIVEHNEQDNIGGPIQINYSVVPGTFSSVEAVNDEVAIYAGESIALDLVLNDTSYNGQSLSLEHFANRWARTGEDLTTTDVASGLAFDVQMSGQVTIDASGIPLNLNRLSSKRVEIPYIVRGDDNRDSSLGHLIVIIKNNDEDSDGVVNSIDNCPITANPNQQDSNGNGEGDACEVTLDSDDDGVTDDIDNCTLAANGDQRDTDGDGFGNLCDGDLNNDGAINFADLGLLKSVFFTADPDADLNGDGAVNFADLGLLKSMFFTVPGPSGLAQ